MTDAPADLDEIADELYGLTPADFTARRNVYAKGARQRGDRDLAATITALRRPTQSAWILNQWIRRHPDGIDAIVELGTALREAQRRGALGRLRDLADRRRHVIVDAAAGIGEVAADLGARMSPATEREITQTLRAAIADEATARLLGRGRLVVAAEYSGFGPAGIVAVPDAPTEDPADQANAGADDATEAAEIETRRRHAEAELRRAESRRDDAQQAVSDAAESVSAAAAEVGTLTDETDRLRAELARAEQELGFARRRHSTADDAATAAAGELRSAERAVAAAREVLDRLPEA
ncbi:hypothetical protein ABLE92_16615 [Gordonia sp. VNQ95]|jgi:hypothetical protein|uniref:hypothetical protein n=1 Tax=Gordonia TaxID=2053 RepID=UPI0032B3C574